MSTLQILDRTGDTCLTWDTARPDGAPAEKVLSVEEVRARFNKLVQEEKALAYAVTVGDAGADPVVIREFDPDALRIVVSPQMVGG